MCAHMCMHTGTDMHTHAHPGVHVHTWPHAHACRERSNAHNARGLRAMAVMERGPWPVARRARRAQQSTGTPSVEKIMPMVGS